MVKLSSRYVSHQCAQVTGFNFQNAVLFQEDDKIKAMLTNHQLADDQVTEDQGTRQARRTAWNKWFSPTFKGSSEQQEENRHDRRGLPSMVHAEATTVAPSHGAGQQAGP